MSQIDESATNQAAHSGRAPDVIASIANAKVSGWQTDDKGWTFTASRSYRDQSGETKYSQMTLFERDLLNMAACLQRMAKHVMTPRNHNS